MVDNGTTGQELTEEKERRASTEKEKGRKAKQERKDQMPIGGKTRQKTQERKERTRSQRGRNYVCSLDK